MAKDAGGSKNGQGGGGSAPNFARDLGYLDKFFDAIESHAGTLDAARGGRLRALMGEERTRWQEIRGLLGAGPATAPAASTPRPQATSAAVSAPVVARAARSANPADPDLAPAPKPAQYQFTVGPLRSRNRG